MAGLPKKYAKMGFKKGWRAYAASRRKVHKKTQSKKVTRTMARRRRYFKRKSYGKKGGMSFGSAGRILTGAIMAGVYEVFVSPMIPLQGMTKNLVELVLGIYLMSARGMPSMIRSFGTALAFINAYSIVISYIPGQQVGESWGS